MSRLDGTAVNGFFADELELSLYFQQFGAYPEQPSPKVVASLFQFQLDKQKEKAIGDGMPDPSGCICGTTKKLLLKCLQGTSEELVTGDVLDRMRPKHITDDDLLIVVQLQQQHTFAVSLLSVFFFLYTMASRTSLLTSAHELRVQSYFDNQMYAPFLARWGDNGNTKTGFIKALKLLIYKVRSSRHNVYYGIPRILQLHTLKYFVAVCYFAILTLDLVLFAYQKATSNKNVSSDEKYDEWQKGTGDFKDQRRKVRALFDRYPKPQSFQGRLTGT
jgi:hypothetical protein